MFQIFLTLFLITIFFQLGPWLAVEVPDLIGKGLIQYKEKSEGEKS